MKLRKMLMTLQNYCSLFDVIIIDVCSTYHNSIFYKYFPNLIVKISYLAKATTTFKSKEN